MKSKIRKAALLVIAATFLLSSAVYADHGDKKWSKHEKEGRLEKISAEIGLTAEQEAQLKEQREAFKAKQKDLGERLMTKNKELKEELEKPQVNRAKIDQIISDIQILAGEKMRNRVDKILAMKNTLTPEQFNKLQKKMEKKRCDSRGKDTCRPWFKR